MKSDPTQYISTPITFIDADSMLEVKHNLESEIALLDNLIELIVFTPRGSFLADPEFGFEYWNHEYSNIQYQTFNSGQGLSTKGNGQEITKIECQESIKNSLWTYAPQLKRVNVTVELNAAKQERLQSQKKQSKHQVIVVVEGDIEKGIGISHYKKEVAFLIEPTVRKRGQQP